MSPTRTPTRTAGEASPDARVVEQTRRRFLRRRRARRLLMWRRIALVVAATAAIGGLGWLIFFSPVLAVKGAVVEGLDVLSVAEVETAADVPVGTPLARADLSAVAARVEALAAVDSVAVSRSWPDTIAVVVTERVSVATVQRDGQWHGLDDEGVLFRTYPERPSDLPEVRMRASTPVDALAAAATVVRALPADLLARVAFLEVRTKDSIALTLRGGGRVVWGSAEESARKVQVLGVLLRQEARSYDVSAPGRPTVRF